MQLFLLGDLLPGLWDCGGTARYLRAAAGDDFGDDLDDALDDCGLGLGGGILGETAPFGGMLTVN